MDKLGLISRNKNSISNLTRHRLAPGAAPFLALGSGIWVYGLVLGGLFARKIARSKERGA